MTPEDNPPVFREVKRAAEDWARYQVAVGEASDQINPVEEPKPECRELFG
jgi:hypothetical protein